MCVSIKATPRVFVLAIHIWHDLNVNIDRYATP